MGRKKIKIDYIADLKLRQITFCKRKRGLLKKAMELSLLCGQEVFLAIYEPSLKKTIVYNSLKDKDDLIQDILSMNKYTESYTNDNVLWLL